MDWNDLLGMLAVLAVGGGVAAWGIYNLWVRSRFRKAGVMAVGEIVKTGGTEYGSWYEVRYRTSDFSEHVKRVGVPDFLLEATRSVGDPIEIKHLPDRPRRVVYPPALDYLRTEVASVVLIAAGAWLLGFVASALLR
jgi:hypothetical protein